MNGDSGHGFGLLTNITCEMIMNVSQSSSPKGPKGKIIYSLIESLYVPWSRLSRFFGDGKLLPPLMTESLFHGYINPYYWVDEFIPYYMEIMGV